MKRIISVILSVLLILSCAASAAGYSLDPDAMNESAASVTLLASYNIINELIATGSGFCAFDGKYIVTNYHVIEGADVVVAYTDAGEEIQINYVLCADSGRDLAILVTDDPAALQPLPLNDTGEVTRGAPVVTIGSPFGFRNSITVGNISTDEEEHEGFIGFNAPISSGSSGGALLDDDGRVIGVTSLTYGASADAQKMNFAVNIRSVIELFDAYKDNTPVPLRKIESVDEKSKAAQPISSKLPDSREFSISNLAGFSITEVYLYPDGASSWGKTRNTSGWLTANNTMKFTVTDEEAMADTLYTVNVCFYYQKYAYYIDFTGIDLKQLLGRTLVIRMVNGNTVAIDIE